MALEINGITVSGKGKIKGKVKKVLSIEDVNKVSDEHIVITNNNSPLFSLAFMKAKAIVSEKGGMLCHLAIVAREMNKPCLLDAKGIVDSVNDDEEVIIDCENQKIILKDKNGQRN